MNTTGLMHMVEIRAERAKDKWIPVKGPWPLEDCMDYVVRMVARSPARMYRVSEQVA